MSILEKIQPAYEVSQHRKIMIYGTPGSGKSVFCGTAPNSLLISFEAGGTDSLLNHDGMENVQVLDRPTMKELDEVVKELKDADSSLSKQVDTVCLDTMTTLRARYLDLLMRKLKQRNDPNRNTDVPSEFEYVQCNNTLRKVMYEFNDLPKHFIMTAHMVEKKDDSSGFIVIRPDLSDRILSTAYGLVSVMGFMQARTDKEGNTIRTLTIKESDRVLAKTRLGGLPNVIKDPTFDVFINANRKVVG